MSLDELNGQPELSTDALDGIAIIGMSGKFPGARNVREFWNNQLSGIEAISQFSIDELEITQAEETAGQPNYVRARAILEGIDLFDADFFGILPKDAALMDPQQRLFLECCWQALEEAGYDPNAYPGMIGVIAGTSYSSYFQSQVCTEAEFKEDFLQNYQIGNYQAMMGNHPDFLATRVAYKFNLRGPSFTVVSACSTSLVAVCQACQSLLTYQSDMMLAGGVSITLPQKRGYLYQDGGMGSADGHCRPFDADAQGTVFGSAVGVVLLKRLEDAIADGDQIYSVIRGFATNNDGATKIGYTAPSIEGQASVIQMAQQAAGIDPATIGYVEAHGTATPMGDPIELAALEKAFRAGTQAKGFCTIGTAKANVGHLDIAAGVTGLIHAAHVVRHGKFPPTLHFKKPTEKFDFVNSPFTVTPDLADWTSTDHPRRAGVSSFGVGGTNAHIIIEEPPSQAASDAGRAHQLLVWSARSAAAADKIAVDLSPHFAANPEINLADAAYTLQTGRRMHRFRRAMVVSTTAQAAEAFGDAKASAIAASDSPLANPSVVFCFPGQGAQAIGMGARLYQAEPVFRHHLDLCDDKLRPLLGESLLSVMYPAEATDEARTRLNQTLYAQPAIFAIEYALAHLWMSWGIRPAAMVGHSVGEYVAACLAGVFSLDDALRLIAARCRLMQDLAPGSMLAVRTSEETTKALLGDELEIAAANSPQLTVVSGPDDRIDEFISVLDAQKIFHRKLATSHAFHSRMVDPALAPFAEYVQQVRFDAPAIPYVSTLTGEWITASDVAVPEYWTRQLRHTVRFADAIRKAAELQECIFLEIGPSETLVQMIRPTIGVGAGKPPVLSTLGSARDGAEPEDKAMLQALGKLWTAGVKPDWPAFHEGYRRKRVLLPTYPFERKSYWHGAPIQAKPQTKAKPTLIATVATASLHQAASAEEPIMATTVSPKTLSAELPSMLNDLKLLITDLSGTDLTDADASASLLELGFDSLFLTQLTQGIQSRYRVKLTFRQIMESYPTLASLAGHLEEKVDSALRTPAPTPAPVIAAAPLAAPAALTPGMPLPAAGSMGGYEALFQSQMQAMTALFQQQLAALQGQAVVPPMTSATASVAVPIASVKPAVAQVPSAPTAPSAAASATAPSGKSVFTPFKPLQRGTAGDLTPNQSKYLDAFTRNYNERTATSKDFTQKHRSVFADGRVVSGFNAQIKELVYPLVVDKAKGAYLWDKDGNRYIDILNGFGAILYGHSPDFVVDAVRAQLEIGFPIGPQTELVGECAELIRDMTGMDRVTFCNTGSEAVMGAMRLARTVTGRNLIVLFSGDYHGSFDEVLVKAVGQHRSMPSAPGIPRESVANILVLDYGTAESLEIIRQRADEIAAVLVEPVQSRHPEVQPVEFLHEVRRITEQSGTALIFDEVVTGFRTHPGGLQALFGVRADIATYGKVVAGGLPVGVLTGSPTYMDALDGGFWQYGDDSFPQAGVTFYAGTFMRHPLAMAAVRASLRHLKAAGGELQTNLNAKTSNLVRDLRSMFAEFEVPSAIETFSSWFYFGVPQDPRLARLLHFHLRNQGIHIQENYPCFLTTAHTDEDLNVVRAAFRTSLEQMRAGEALHRHETAVAPAAPVVAAAATQPVTAAPVLQAVAREIPITEQQREILFGTQLGDEANCAFNESTSLSLKGSLREQELLIALEHVVARHESLRSTVDENGDIIHIAAKLPVHLEHVDLSTLPEVRRQDELNALLKHEGSTPFDLNRGPLFRATLVRLAPEDAVLVFTSHHIVLDGWSTNVLYSELSELYNAAVAGRVPVLGPPMSFSQYANDQKAKLGTTERDAVVAYWLDQFKTVPPPLAIPTDHPRQALRTNSGTTQRFLVEAELSKAIRKAGAKQGSTLFATLLAAYSLLIHRLTQQDDVVVGVPMAGQSLLENGAALIGHCVNFLPIRSTLLPAESLAEFIKRTRGKLLDAQDHQDYTYGTLLQKLNIQRDPSRLQLVEVQFNVEQVGAGLKFDGLTADLHANPKTSVNMDLFFNFIDRGSELWLDCDYNTDLFDSETIERWFGHFEAILRATVKDVTQTAVEVPLLNAEQQQTILTDWNNTTTEYPRDESIASVFEQQVARTPGATAVTFGDRSLTYTELNEKANQLAHFLVRAGAGRGSAVAVCLERSFEAIVSLLAILKAGAFYVPIDPSYPAARLSFLIADSGSKLLLTERAITPNLPSLPVNIVQLDHDWPSIAIESTVDLPVTVTAEDPAYVIYTSGSTGTPKGVLVPQRAVLRLVKNNPFASFAAEEVFLQLAPLSFDASTFEIWGALLNGARLVLGSRERTTPAEIGRLIEMHGVTTLWLTAALFHLMVTEHIEMLRPLRQLLAGGDVLSVAHVRRVLETLPRLKLINGYGPTENTTFTCCHPITLQSLESGTVPIGRPISNTRIYILDAHKKPVPPGVAGELCAAGDGLALEYLNSPELTAEKFISIPLDNGRVERLYRTGDLCRYRADGTVEFLGRVDTQVKIRGYRMELGEIENALESSPLVRSAVVAVRTDWGSDSSGSSDKRLAAYVVAAGEQDGNGALIQQLRQHLQTLLPEYMQPAAIMVLESLPRTLNGKVDRRALPAPQPEQLMRERSIVYPRNTQEETLAGIWSKVLGVKEVGIEDSIFELGGDSLLIFRITTLANQAGLKLTARHIFQYRNIAAICAQLESNNGAENTENTVSTIQAVPRSRYRKPQTILQ